MKRHKRKQTKHEYPWEPHPTATTPPQKKKRLPPSQAWPAGPCATPHSWPPPVHPFLPSGLTGGLLTRKSHQSPPESNVGPSPSHLSGSLKAKTNPEPISSKARRSQAKLSQASKPPTNQVCQCQGPCAFQKNPSSLTLFPKPRQSPDPTCMWLKTRSPKTRSPAFSQALQQFRRSCSSSEGPTSLQMGQASRGTRVPDCRKGEGDSLEAQLAA